MMGMLAVFVLALMAAFQPAMAGATDKDFDAQIAAANARIAAAKLRGQAADASQKVFCLAAKQARTEVNAYSQMYRWLKAAEIQAAKLTSPADQVNGKGFRRFLRACVVIVPATLGGMAVGAVEGATHLTNSPLEYLGAPSVCRGLNTAIAQGAENVFQTGREALTPWQDTLYANPAALYPNAKRVMAWYPLAQMAATGSYAVPVLLTTTAGATALTGVSQSGMIAIDGAAGAVGGFGVGELVNAVEKPLTKRLVK